MAHIKNALDKSTTPNDAAQYCKHCKVKTCYEKATTKLSLVMPDPTSRACIISSLKQLECEHKIDPAPPSPLEDELEKYLQMLDQDA